MRVLLTGSTGRLGGAFLSLWRNHPSFDLQVVNRADLDLSQPEQVKDYLHAQEFDALINPAAVSGLEQCLDNPGLALAVNTLTPSIMAEVCHAKQAQLVHFSTDYVFSGAEDSRLTETAATGPVNTYGRTKLAGEQAVLEASPQALVCRVSWLFGPGPESHFDSTLRRAADGETVSLIADKFSVPTYTHDVVSWTELLLKQRRTGTYHLCNASEPESWHSYGETICALAQKHNLLTQSPNFSPSTLEDAHFFRDPRPRHTAMLPERLINEQIANPRHWKEAAEEYLKIR